MPYGNYGWMRQAARSIVDSPELNDVMEEARASSGGDSLLDKIVSSVKRVAPAAISAAQGALAQLSYSGSTGNFQSALENVTLAAKFQRIVEQAPSKVGSPLNKSVYINTLNGFVKCEHPVFTATTATSLEEDAVEAFMEKGFFYE